MNNTEERTLDALRNALPGKIHIYLRDENTRLAFARDANAGGYRFGMITPAADNVGNIVALEDEKQLSHPGIVGHIAFQCNGGSCSAGMYHRIDYAAYKRGDTDYYYNEKIRSLE